jgi:hypothetical protein
MIDMMQKFPKPPKAKEEEAPSFQMPYPQMNRQQQSPLNDQIHLWFHDQKNLIKFLDSITDGDFERLDGRPTPLFIYKHKKQDGTVDDGAIYASKVELTDENVLVLVGKGQYDVLQIGAYYTNLILKREYPVYTTQKKEGVKDIIDLMIYVQVFPSVLLGKDEKPLYWDVFFPVESQTYRIICIFRPELGSISELMGELNVFRDYIVQDQGVKEIFGRDQGVKEINPRATQGITRVVITYDTDRTFDGLLKSESIHVYRIPEPVIDTR